MKNRILVSFVLAIALLLTQAMPVQAAGPLVAYYDFEEGSGTTANDLSTNNYDGSITNATYSTDVPASIGSNYSLAFDGSGDNLTAMLGSEISGDHSFLVSFWIKYTPNATARQWVMTLGTPASNTAVHFLINNTGMAQFGFWGNALMQNLFSFSPYANQWVEVVTTYNSGTKTLVTFVNGSLMDTDTFPALTPNLAGGAGNNVALNLGQRQVVSAAEADFSGYLDNVFIRDSSNLPPTLSLPGPDPVTALEQTWTILDPAALVTDLDSADFDTGTLTVNILNPFAGDRLNLRNEGAGAGQIGRSGGDFSGSGTVTYSGVAIGTYAWVSPTLTVTFNAMAIPSAVQALVRNIQYIANVNNPNTTQRTIYFVVSDGDGAASQTAVKHVNVQPVNDNPVISNFSPDITYNEGDPALQLDADVSILDPDYLDYNGGTLTLDFSAGAVATDQLTIEALGGITTLGANVYHNGLLFGTYAGGANGTALVVNFNTTAINARITPLLQALAYSNTSENPTGTRTVRIIVTDGDGGTSTAVTKNINVVPVDDPPVAVDDSATLTEDDPATTINVLANDTDIDGGPKTVASVTQPANGTVVITNAGADLTYQPDADYCNGGSPTDDFTYTLNGGSTATVRVTVTCVDDLPSAVDDSATVAEDAAATTIDVLSNDTDPDGGSKVVDSVTQPANGTVVITNAGADLTYQPDADYCNGGSPTDDFTYTLNGGSTASVRVTVTCVDDPPSAVDDTATLAEDDPATTIDVLANDTDIDGGPKTVASVTQPTNGTVVITNAGADLTYDSNVDYCNGGSPTDDFTYTLNGGSTATVRVTVTCGDDAPVAVDDYATVDEDAPPTTINVLANDTDIDGGTMSILSVTQPANGTVVITTSGADLTYEPDDDYCNGGSPTDDFTYTLNGGSTATVHVTVDCINDEPDFSAADPPAVFINAGAQTIVGWVTNFTPGPANESTQGVLAYLISNNTCGTLLSVQPAVGVNGTLTYTPAAGQHGTCTFDLQVQDDGGTVNGGDDTGPVHTITITVLDNLPPFVVNNGIGSIPDTGDGYIAEMELVLVQLMNITVTFSEDLFNPPGDSDPGDVTNPANYILVRSDDSTFASTTCAGGVVPPDEEIRISSVAYDNNGGAGPYTATLSFEKGMLNLNGFYRLIVCGTTSITDLSGNKLAGNGVTAGTDFTRNFILFVGGTPPTGGGGVGAANAQAAIPNTGFAPGQVTQLGGPRVDYLKTSLSIELPRLKLTLPVVGVPFKNNNWDVNWLTAQAGWLQYTAFPGLNGNSVLTSHTTSVFGSEGPFASLRRLFVGDLIHVRNNGTLYTFQVEQILRVKPDDTSIFKHEQDPWLTLVTCEEYDEVSGTYLKRLVVRARLISTGADPDFTP